MEYGGSWSGEHGDGLVRSAYNEQFFGKQLYNALKKVKVLFDPENLMNPGKIVDAQEITENLRYGSNYKDQELATVYKYQTELGFAEAVHTCTGVGECRKLIGGTMCPSFKATRDEEHSTRGRANAMRLAMSGQMDSDGLSSERLHDVLDLCLSCKACKSECPSNVDMAKLKSEVSQIYMDDKGVKLRDRLIRDSSRMAAKFSGTFAPFINRIQSSGMFRYAMEKLAGFDRRRQLPDYARQSFTQWFRKNAKKAEVGTRQVAIFADTYLNYHEPQIGIAAYELLASCGFDVLLADVGCCQRPKISHGFLRDAKKDGHKTAQNLAYFLSKNIPVLVCEPSCASALVDDLPDLIEDDELGERLKSGIYMIDQFLFDEVESGRLNVRFTSSENELMVHGHCHQKSLFGTKAMNSILNKIEGLDHHEVDSGCCGMAGSFGYEKEHYELSKQIGSMELFPATEKLNAEASVVACGFSCRHQISDLTARKPKHWAEVVKAELLD
jgi:Fe-S oxidoreductase